MRNGLSRVDQVVAAIEERMDQRSLLPGAKLPSIRHLARTLAVSKSTVVEAYDRMTASGVIRSHAGSGFYVVGRPAAVSAVSSAPYLDQSIDSLWVSRRSLEPSLDTLKPGAGSLPTSWMPMEEIRRTIRKVSRASEALISNYGTPYGSPELRTLLSRRLIDRGIEAATDQIMLTESGLQAVDLICRAILKPGDTVMVDDPCYFSFLTLLRAHPVKVISIPYTSQGPSLDAFQAAIAAHRPRLYLTNSGLHNPTGATMSSNVAYKLLTLSTQSDLTIVEDDVFADFELEQTPRLAAFDGLTRVIHISSFSKIFSSGTRCGYIAANRDLIEKLVNLKLATCFGGNPLTAHVVHGLLKDGSYRKHVNTLKPRLARAMTETISRLENLGIKPWIIPKGGIFIWAHLPDGLDSADISNALLKEKVVLAPGNLFSLTQSAGPFLRFNITRSSQAKIFDALDKVLNMGALKPE